MGDPPPNRSSAAVARTAYTAGAGAGALERGPVERRRGAEDRDAVEPRGAAAEVRRHSVWRAPRQSGPFGCGVCRGGAIGAEAEEAWRRVSRRLRATRWCERSAGRERPAQAAAAAAAAADNLPKFKDQIISLEYVNDCKGVKVEGATYNMKRFLTMQVIGFSWRNPDTLAPWKPHKKPHFRRGQTQAWTWQRALENGLTHCHWAKACDPQAFLTEEEKARGVKGAWLIVEALGEELDVKLQNLANLCEHWGWGLDFGSVNT